jgi:hypothetical protein
VAKRPPTPEVILEGDMICRDDIAVWYEAANVNGLFPSVHSQAKAASVPLAATPLLTPNADDSRRDTYGSTKSRSFIRWFASLIGEINTPDSSNLPQGIKVKPITLVALSAGSALTVVLLLLFTISAIFGKKHGPVSSSQGNIQESRTANNYPGEATLQYCVAVVKAEKEANLDCNLPISDLGASCGQLATQISKISTRNVDQFFINWADEYSSLLFNMNNCCETMSQRSTGPYQVRRFMEAYQRGRVGDPFGVVLEDMSAAEQEKLLRKTFDTQRFELLLKLQRRYNSIAPETAQMSVDRNSP